MPTIFRLQVRVSASGLPADAVLSQETAPAQGWFLALIRELVRLGRLDRATNDFLHDQGGYACAFLAPPPECQQGGIPLPPITLGAEVARPTGPLLPGELLLLRVGMTDDALARQLMTALAAPVVLPHLGPAL